MALTFSWADASGPPHLTEFLTRTYGRDSFQALPGRWQWLLADHPGGLHLTLCHDGPRLVGLCGHHAFSLDLSGAETIGAAYGLDFMVAPDCRRRGIGRRFLQMRLDRFAVSISTGQSETMAALYERAGGRIIGRIWQACYHQRPPGGGGLRHVLRGWLAWGQAISRRRVNGRRRPLDLAAAATALAGFECRHRPGEIGPLPTPDYLRWRYGGSVYPDHRFWELTTAGNEQGILVTRAALRGEVLVELLCRPAARHRLLRLAGQTAAGGECRVLVGGDALASGLRAAGFLVRPRPGRIVAMAKDPVLLQKLTRVDYLCYAGASDLDLLRRPEGSYPTPRE